MLFKRVLTREHAHQNACSLEGFDHQRTCPPCPWVQTVSQSMYMYVRSLFLWRESLKFFSQVNLKKSTIRKNRKQICKILPSLLQHSPTHPTRELWDEQISNMYFWEIQSLTLVFFTETVNHSWFLLGWCCCGDITQNYLSLVILQIIFALAASIFPYLHNKWGICTRLPPTQASHRGL